MTTLPLYVGLDYHQDSVRLCALDASGGRVLERTCPNRWEAIAEAAASRGAVAAAAVEACAGAADLAEELIAKAAWPLKLAHAGYVARMRRGPDKSDRSDAAALADLARVGYVPEVWLPPQSIRELRRLVRFRQEVVEQTRAAKLRIRALLREHRVERPSFSPWSKAWRTWLEKLELPRESRFVLDRQLARLAWLGSELRAADARLAEATRDDPVVKKLRTLPQVGQVTAWVLRAGVGSFQRFGSGKQLARFCGVTPRNASSGQRQADAGLVRAGDPLVRATLVELAHRLIRTQPRWRELAQRVRGGAGGGGAGGSGGGGKSACLAAAAVANRWTRWLYHQMQEQDQTQTQSPLEGRSG